MPQLQRGGRCRLQIPCIGLLLPEMKTKQKLAATGRDKINMSCNSHASLLGLQKDNNLMSSMCHGDVATTSNWFVTWMVSKNRMAGCKLKKTNKIVTLDCFSVFCLLCLLTAFCLSYLAWPLWSAEFMWLYALSISFCSMERYHM